MSNEIEQIEISMEQAKKKIADCHALERLESNADFKALFSEGYLKDYAVRLVGLKASMHMQDPKQQHLIEGQLNAIGHLSQYMLFIKQEGRVAEESLEADSAEREALLKEEAEAAEENN